MALRLRVFVAMPLRSTFATTGDCLGSTLTRSLLSPVDFARGLHRPEMTL